MVLCIALAVATSIDGSNLGAAVESLRLATCAPQAPQNSTQDPRPTPSHNGFQNPPAAPAGETSPGSTEPEADMGGNPAPLPASNAFFLERQLSGLGLEKHGIRVFGWTQGNYTASSAEDFNTPTAFNDRADYFQLNQNWLE
nr:hypothetical protein [Planctomycetota bacterium]